MLVWYGHFPTMNEAIAREKLLKKWHRDWKFRLIESMNPDWRDLHDEIDTNIIYAEMEKASPRPACCIPGDCGDRVGVARGVAFVRERFEC